MRLSERLQRRWYSERPAPWVLQPLSVFYGAVARARRRRLSAAAWGPEMPVIVVGNIAVGGTGKTPFVIWLAERLRAWGWRPGVVSRGHGGEAPAYPLLVQPDTPATVCGDEPLLIRRRLGLPVAVDPDRCAAARLLADTGQVNILVSDDGLQHYRLRRDLEICLVDGRRRFGNGALLPAGPLRESPQRLAEVDWVVVNGADWEPLPGRSLAMRLRPGAARRLADGRARPLDAWAGQQVRAFAGIGDPARFFGTLRAAGLLPLPHLLPDHHPYTAADFAGLERECVFMTEKDAVKCAGIAPEDSWYLPVEAELSLEHEALVRESVETLRRL